VNSTLEPNGLSRDDGKRPDGMILVPWIKGQPLVWDVTVVDTLQNQRNSLSRGFSLPFNVETLQAFGALFQIPHYYRKFLYYKTKMLCNYVINIKFNLMDQTRDTQHY
jgi:hypothetical protein